MVSLKATFLAVAKLQVLWWLRELNMLQLQKTLAKAPANQKISLTADHILFININILFSYFISFTF